MPSTWLGCAGLVDMNSATLDIPRSAVPALDPTVRAGLNTQLGEDALRVLLVSRIFSGTTLLRHFTITMAWDAARLADAFGDLHDGGYMHVVDVGHGQDDHTLSWLICPEPISSADLTTELATHLAAVEGEL